jgi:transcriptional regulator with XRE-family HTH domain
MAKSSPFEQAAGAGRDRLWLHLGSRIRFRREQLRISAPRAAAHVGVALQTYEQYESGERLIPATQLAEVAEFFAVPVFYFFEDLQIGEPRSDAQQTSPDAVYAVATQSDRIAALIEDFQKLDFERQQHLLAVARALASDKPREAPSA